MNMSDGELRSRWFGKVKCQRWSSAKQEDKRATAEKVHGRGTWRRMVGVTGGEAKSKQGQMEADGLT